MKNKIKTSSSFHSNSTKNIQVILGQFNSEGNGLKCFCPSSEVKIQLSSAIHLQKFLRQNARWQPIKFRTTNLCLRMVMLFMERFSCWALAMEKINWIQKINTPWYLFEFNSLVHGVHWHDFRIFFYLRKLKESTFNVWDFDSYNNRFLCILDFLSVVIFAFFLIINSCMIFAHTKGSLNFKIVYF